MLLVWLFGFLFKQFIYEDPLPLPYAATSARVRTRVRHHLRIGAVCRISALELQNSRYRRFLYITGTSSVGCVKSLPHMARNPRFVAFPDCTFGTKRRSCTPLASRDVAGACVAPHLLPGKARCHISTLWESAPSRPLGKRGPKTVSGNKAECSNTPFQSLQLYFTLHSVSENFLWMSTSFSMHYLQHLTVNRSAWSSRGWSFCWS